MKRINLLDVTDITNQKSSPLWEQFTTIATSEMTLEIPRPVMVGLGVFVLMAEQCVQPECVLRYDGYEFYTAESFNKHQSPGVVKLWKYLTDAGLEYMSKVCSHDYTAIEHFVRRKGERIPIEIDGFQTKVIVNPRETSRVDSELFIRQTLQRGDLMRLANRKAQPGQVVNRVLSAVNNDEQRIAL